jgi:hypothetical protein
MRSRPLNRRQPLKVPRRKKYTYACDLEGVRLEGVRALRKKALAYFKAGALKKALKQFDNTYCIHSHSMSDEFREVWGWMRSDEACIKWVTIKAVTRRYE